MRHCREARWLDLVHGSACSRCNISFVSFGEAQFALRTPVRPVQVYNGPGRVQEAPILRNPAARPAERECSAGTPCILPQIGSGGPKGEFEMRSLLILLAICISGTAFAQNAPPKVGSKALVQAKPRAPMGCKLVRTVRGTKLWAGDCVGTELRGSTTDDLSKWSSGARRNDRISHARSEGVRSATGSVSDQLPL